MLGDTEVGVHSICRKRRHVINSGASNLVNRLRRIGLWFGSLLLSVTLFSLLFNLHFSGPGFFRVGTVLLVFRVTLIFALPVWCLYLPFVIALKDAEEGRMWTILISGVLIGPAALVFWGLLLQLRGADPDAIWRGDPLAIGMGGAVIFALIVGFLTTSVYVIAALKVLHHRSLAAKGRSTWT
jgi:hypothetical protein